MYGTDFMTFLDNTADKKSKSLITTSMVQHPTGFMHLDYGVGSYLTVCDDDEVPIYTYHNIGITSGSVNVLISKSQGGKTSLAIAMGMAIIEPYINAMLYQKYIDANRPPKQKVEEFDGTPFIQIADTEKTLPIDYVKKLTRYPNKMLRRHVMINPITTDKDLIDLVEKHCKYKVEHLGLQVSPMLDIFGKPIIEYPPTVLIIDSTSQLLLEEVDDLSKAGKKDGMMSQYESATQGPAGARRARIISQLYSQLVNYAKKYNIIIFSINHINKQPPIMGVPVKQYRGLRAGETIGGGERAIYLAANILRLDVIKNVGGVSSSAVQLGDDIKGHISIASWIKSKSNSKSNTCQLVYTDRGGYDPLLSDLWFDKETGDLAKAGNFFYVNKYPDLRFTLKNYQEVFADHPELFSAYYDQRRDQCASMLDDPDRAARKHNQMINEIRKDIQEDVDMTKSEAHDMDDIFEDAMITND